MPAKTFTPGNREDFDYLYQEHYPRLVRSLRLMLGDQSSAEDCVQEAFVRAWKAWPTHESYAPVGAWLYRIAVNRARSYAKARRRLLWGRRESLETVAAPSDLMLSSELGIALRNLPKRIRMVIIMRYLDGYNNRDIAQMLSLNERTIGRDIATGLKKLKKLLGVGNV